MRRTNLSHYIFSLYFYPVGGRRATCFLPPYTTTSVSSRRITSCRIITFLLPVFFLPKIEMLYRVKIFLKFDLFMFSRNAVEVLQVNDVQKVWELETTGRSPRCSLKCISTLMKITKEVLSMHQILRGRKGCRILRKTQGNNLWAYWAL